MGVDSGLDMIGNEEHEPKDHDHVIFNADDDSEFEVPRSDDDEPVVEEQAQQPKSTSAPKATVSRRAIGRTAVAKQAICADNPMDNRIRELVFQKYNNTQIVQTLINEGYPAYTPSAIGSRWRRIREFDEKMQEEKLDDELSDWHEGEDEKLEEAVIAVEAKTKREIQKIEDKKWNEISKLLADGIGGKKKYTGKACKERWEGLQSGEALLPIELDPDKEGRKKKRELRYAEKMRRRAEEMEQVKRAEQAKIDAKNQKEQLKWEKKMEKFEAKKAAQVEREEDKRIRAEKLRGIKQKADEKREARRAAKAAADEKLRIRELEERMYRKLTGKKLNRMNRKTKDGDEDSIQGHEGDDGDTGDDENQGGSSKPRVTADTLKNPRSVMSDEELKVLLHKRGLPRRGDTETHPEVVARLHADDYKLNRATLNSLLGEYFDKGKGRQEVRIDRLQKYDANNSEAGKKGVRATDPEFIERYEGYVNE